MLLDRVPAWHYMQYAGNSLLGRVVGQARSISAANLVLALHFRARLVISSTFLGCAEGETSPRTAHARSCLYFDPTGISFEDWMPFATRKCDLPSTNH